MAKSPVPTDYDDWSDWIWDRKKRDWYSTLRDAYGNHTRWYKDEPAQSEDSYFQEDTASNPPQLVQIQPAQSQNICESAASTSAYSPGLSSTVNDATTQLDNSYLPASSPSSSEPTLQKESELPISILDVWGNEKLRVAVMDTGNTGAVGECDVLVSSHVVADLGLWDKIDWHAPKKYKITANGTAMESEGTIKLTWKRAAGRNTRQDVFYVFRDLNEDINLGRNFLAALGIFQGFNVGILSTLKEAWTESEYHQAQAQQQQCIQKQGAAASEDRIRRSEEKKAAKHSTSRKDYSNDKRKGKGKGL